MILISCLTVTQESRFSSLQRAVADYSRQTHRDRELVIVHDGSGEFHARLCAWAQPSGQSDINIYRATAGLTLGELRNIAVAQARGDFVCQWDDDDRYHPLRLELQFDALRAAGSEFCFLSDQLHLFLDLRKMYWDDWEQEAPPLNFIQGTLLGRKDKLGPYPALVRGEDTPVVQELLRRGHTVTRLREHGYLYVYVFDGRNAWDYEHHAAISAGKRFPGARLIRLAPTLTQRLAEYDPPLGRVTMPYQLGELVFGDGD
jgi:glycosyltransferase involved in cell wall biosynthesis